MAMVGGGPGSFIGPVHLRAAELDREIVLVAGAFSSDPAKSLAAGSAYGLDPSRCYPDVAALLAGESVLEHGAEMIAIVTPNYLHAEAAEAALRTGFHVLSDKPATATLAEANSLAKVAAASDRLYGLTFTYTGYAMVREARERVRRGDIGQVRKVTVEYSQGWLSTPIEETGNKQAEWRTDKARSGVGGCIGDIGVHGFNLLEYVTGRAVTEFCADLSAVVPGRALDDDCNVLLRLDNGAPGVLTATQIAAGDRNGLRLRVSGELGTLIWNHEEPDILTLNWPDAPAQVLHAGAAYLTEAGAGVARLPTGHPEGFIEAFANIYRDFARAIRSGEPAQTVPGIEQGLRAQAFVEIAVDASARRAGWVTLSTENKQ